MENRVLDCTNFTNALRETINGMGSPSSRKRRIRMIVGKMKVRADNLLVKQPLGFW